MVKRKAISFTALGWLLTVGGCQLPGGIEGFGAGAMYPRSMNADPDYAAEIVWPVSHNPACPDWKADQSVVINRSISLPENCSYTRVKLQFNASDIDFDCNGAVFNGLERVALNPFGKAYAPDEAPVGIAFRIASTEADRKPLKNIRIRNCQVINYTQAVNIRLEMSQPTIQSLRQGSGSEADLRAIAPAGVSVENSRFINMHGSAVYVHHYVTGFSLTGSSVKGSAGPGLYLDAGSSDARIRDSIFEGNGYTSYSSATRKREKRSSLKAKREGIAVDGSFGNTITGNRFINNADGGIYLYKNCWEHASENENQIPRTRGADNNIIDGNVFRHEGVAVWVAERADRDLRGFNCGDPLVHRFFGNKYYRDYARGNRISNNRFESVHTGVRVMGDNTTLSNNTFINTVGRDIVVGSRIRQKTGQPVAGTRLEDNQLSSHASVLFEYKAN